MRNLTSWLAAIGLMTGAMIPSWAQTGSSSGAEASHQTAVQKMAVIMHRLKHFPDPKTQGVLQQIFSDPKSSEREKDLAGAIMRLNHRARLDDQIKLKKIMENEKASAEERDLASIIYHLDHRPTKGDKTRLQEIMKQ